MRLGSLTGRTDPGCWLWNSAKPTHVANQHKGLHKGLGNYFAGCCTTFPDLSGCLQLVYRHRRVMLWSNFRNATSAGIHPLASTSRWCCSTGVSAVPNFLGMYSPQKLSRLPSQSPSGVSAGKAMSSGELNWSVCTAAFVQLWIYVDTCQRYRTLSRWGCKLYLVCSAFFCLSQTLLQTGFAGASPCSKADIAGMSNRQLQGYHGTRARNHLSGCLSAVLLWALELPPDTIRYSPRYAQLTVEK